MYEKVYLQLLAKQYPNVQKVSEEIINLQAILNLPKGTELFLSDIHGEYDSFSHILRNGSGIIIKKIEDIFTHQITSQEKSLLATLIYYPEEKLVAIKKEISDLKEWYKITLYRLIKVARDVCSKYSRSKVRKALPSGFDYIIDELLNIQEISPDKEKYYNQIVNSIVELNQSDEFIVAISGLIKRMAVDHLHVVGDIYDRGPSAEEIMNTLVKFHSVDVQWGNHDVLWMGAAAGSKECICNVIRICSRYDNIRTLEEGYGINTRPLATFALETYDDEVSEKFLPKVHNYNKYVKNDEKIMAKIQKAIAIIQFKLEGSLIKRRPEFMMEDRLLLDKINFDDHTINIGGVTYLLNDKSFPTIDPANPHKLTEEEENVIDRLQESFMHSELLNRHMNFLYSNGGLYKRFNSNLLFHGCIPMDENGDFDVISIKGLGDRLSGKKYFDATESIIRKTFFKKNNQKNLDFMWYFWCGPKSPLFGKDKAATFERYFIDDKQPHKEVRNPYYKYAIEESTCLKIFDEFEMCRETSHVINGHTPIKEKDGESPIKANGKLLVIDGGFAKSYRKETGRAGYTLSYDSYGLVLYANEPFSSVEEVIREEKDIKYEIMVNEKAVERKIVRDTDAGKGILKEIEGLTSLLKAFKDGSMKEKF
ncbi:MAG: fructose-1,6-bisphosphatase [Defluviitaleaceae bacterium]|nr:fructose-1,6-bisphosphatase [Defluviitaleaceae bacterium]